MPNRKVVILQNRLPHYRVPLFERIKRLAAARDIELHLVHGQASPSEALRHDSAELPWTDGVANRIRSVAGTEFVWQPIPHGLLDDAGLIVMQQENRILSNYPLLLRLRARDACLAFWGHGTNFQAGSRNGIGNRIKKWLTCHVDFWFAYTQITVGLLREAGFPPDRIVNLNNATDTEGLRAQVAAVTAEQKAALRRELGIPQDAPIGLFCGSLVPTKRLEFLAESGDLIRARHPDYHVVVLGEGPGVAALRAAAASRPWLHVMGLRVGMEKAIYMAAAQVTLNPGLVGLHILDSFAAGLPLMTTEDALHSPEIIYLEHGVNGVSTRGDVGAYAEGVARLLGDEALRRRMSEAAVATSRRYSVDAMAENFVAGMDTCLRMGRRRRSADARGVLSAV